MIPESAIIVSSGRCGSTMLSNLIAAETETLSVQESLSEQQWVTPFGNDARSGGAVDFDRAISGEEYWAMMKSPWFMGRLGLITDELRYPSRGRWGNRLAELPSILAVTLPAISDTPDDLFDTLATVVSNFPVQRSAAHHAMLLNHLTLTTGKRRWVERSGGSSAMTSRLVKDFPEASIVYLTRNVNDTALSMSKHPSFQLTALRLEFLICCGVDPFTEWKAGREFDESTVPDEYRSMLPWRLTAENLHDWARDVGRFRAFCAYMAGQAEQTFSDRSPKRLLRLTYEQLVADPMRELTRLGEFLNFVDPAAWAAQNAERPSRRGTSESIGKP